MTNASTYAHNFARNLAVADRRVELEFIPDRALWPWLSLAPGHPVLIEKYQYFGAMTASWAMQLFAPEAFTALTRFDWRCEPAALAATQHATRGLCRGRNDDDGMGFSLDVSSSEGAVFYRTSGDGFVFTDRDFRAWREKCRQQAEAAGSTAAFMPLSPSACGLGADGHSFVGRADDAACLLAQVERGAGFFPQHPFHTGSGDHVNAAQLLDCALQAAHWFQGRGADWPTALVCLAGEARFQRYVELDVPFEIHRIGSPDESGIALQFVQGGRDNARISLQFAPPGDASVENSAE